MEDAPREDSDDDAPYFRRPRQYTGLIATTLITPIQVRESLTTRGRVFLCLM